MHAVFFLSRGCKSSFAGDNLDEAEQVATAQLTTGVSTIVTRSMARRASGAQPGTQVEGSPMIQYPQPTPRWKPWATV